MRDDERKGMDDLDRLIRRASAAILEANDDVEDYDTRRRCRRIVLDQHELLRHRVAVLMGLETAYEGEELCIPEAPPV